MKSGRRRQKNGKRISAGSIENHKNVFRLLVNFSRKNNFLLRVYSTNNINQRGLRAENLYWKRFYIKFTNYLYHDLKHYDNYVGAQIKLIRAFFNYLNEEMLINTGSIQKLFYVPHENIQIVVLSPERLNQLIHSNTLDSKLNEREKEARDFFIFGCTVALRFSDMVRLRKTNIELIGENYFLSILSKKTRTYTRVKLPRYAINIINKYQNKYKKNLLPYFGNSNLNKYVKRIMVLAGYTEPYERIRTRRGVSEIIYFDKSKKSNYRFCDMITTHTMRRTAITTMISLGMNDELVRLISGHAANSLEFNRYVSYSQAYLDKDINKMHKVMEKPLSATV